MTRCRSHAETLSIMFKARLLLLPPSRRHMTESKAQFSRALYGRRAGHAA
jgi:hypothetical protein